MLTFDVDVRGQRVSWYLVEAVDGAASNTASALGSATLEAAFREHLARAPSAGCDVAQGEHVRVTFARPPGVVFPGAPAGRQGYHTPQVTVSASNVPGGGLPGFVLEALRAFWGQDMRRHGGANLRKWDRVLPGMR